MRLFIAVHLAPETRAAVEAIQARFRRLDPGDAVRWVDPKGIHLTLKFLGEVPDAEVAPLEAALDAAIAGRTAPELGASGTGGFPNSRRPRVLWVGLREEGDRLKPLQAAVEAAVRPLGWEPEARPFQPHLTLGRVREDERGRSRQLDPSLLEALAAPADPTGAVTVQDRAALIRSRLSPAGARYEDVRVWKLS
jgi:RNA 2',3'-cyclic 3'-phosphodiesterase